MNGDEMLRALIEAVCEALIVEDPGMGNPPTPLWELYTPEGCATVIVNRIKPFLLREDVVPAGMEQVGWQSGWDDALLEVDTDPENHADDVADPMLTPVYRWKSSAATEEAEMEDPPAAPKPRAPVVDLMAALAQHERERAARKRSITEEPQP